MRKPAPTSPTSVAIRTPLACSPGSVHPLGGLDNLKRAALLYRERACHLPNRSRVRSRRKRFKDQSSAINTALASTLGRVFQQASNLIHNRGRLVRLADEDGIRYFRGAVVSVPAHIDYRQ